MNSLSRRATLLVVFICCFLLAQISFSDDNPPQPTPTLKSKKAKEGYVIDLQELIKRSKSKIEQVNKKLEEQAVLRRNQQREEKAREYYAKGMRLYEEGKFKEAQGLWNKAVKITEHPEMRGYVHESIRRSKKMEQAFQEEEKEKIKRLELERGYKAGDVDNAYEIAVRLFKQKKWLAAKEEFDHVEEMFPDHKATRSYLMLVEQEIQKDQQKMIETRLKEEAQVHRVEKDQWKHNIEQKEKMQKKELVAQAENAYKQAVILYNARQFVDAKEKFQEVEWVQPDYKNALKYLAHIDEDIQKEKERHFFDKERFAKKKKVPETNKQFGEQERTLKQKESIRKEELKRAQAEAEFVYSAAVALYSVKSYEPSRKKFNEVQSIYPDYKQTRKYLQRISRMIGEASEKEGSIQEAKAPPQKERKVQEQAKGPTPPAMSSANEDDPIRKAEVEHRNQILKEAESYYKEAMAFYKSKNYEDSKTAFIQTEAVMPGYKDTREYLSHIDDDIAHAPNTGMKTIKKSSEKIISPKKKKQVEKTVSPPEETMDVSPQLTSKQIKQEEAKEKRKKEIDEKRLLRLEEQARSEEREQHLADAQRRKKEARAIVAQYNRKRKEAQDQGRIKIELARDEVHPTDVVNIPDASMTSPGSTQQLEKLRKDMLVYDEVDRGQARKDLELFRGEQAKIKLAQKKVLMSQQKEITEQLEQRKRVDHEKLKLYVAGYYKEGQTLFKAGNYKAARAKFVSVDGLWPDYKSVRKYLNKIDVFMQSSVNAGKNMEELIPQREENAASQQEEIKDVTPPITSKQIKQEEAKEKRKKEIDEKRLLRLEEQARSEEREQHLADAQKRKKEARAIVAQYNRKRKEAQDQGRIKIELAKDEAHPTDVANKNIPDASVTSPGSTQQLEKLRKEMLAYDEMDHGQAGKDLEFFRREQAKIKLAQKKVLMSQQKEITEQLNQSKRVNQQKLKWHVDGYYKEGQTLFKAGNYKAARAKFVSVDGLWPDYKSVRKYLVKIDDFMRRPVNTGKIKKEVKHYKSLPLPAKTETELVLKQKNVEEAKLEEMKELPVKAREAAAKEEKISQIREVKILKRDLEKVYKEALALYKSGNSSLSKEKFVKFEKMLSNPQLPQDYVASMQNRVRKDKEQIETKMARERSLRQAESRRKEEESKREQAMLESRREQRLKDLEKKIQRDQKKIDRYQEVVKGSEDQLTGHSGTEEVKDKEKISGSRSVVDLDKEKELRLAKNQKQKVIEREQLEANRQLHSNLEQLYKKGVGFYKLEEYNQAYQIFNEIDKLSPNFKNTKQYLVKIKRKNSLPAQRPVQVDKGQIVVRPSVILRQPKKADEPVQDINNQEGIQDVDSQLIMNRLNQISRRQVFIEKELDYFERQNQ